MGEMPNLLAPPSLDGYSWRPAKLEDAAAIHTLLVDIEAVDQRGWTDTMEDRQRDFEDPATNYPTDTWLAFTDGGSLAALGWIFAPQVGDQEYVAFLWLEVHPSHRGRGLESYVLNWLEARSRQILATRSDHLPHILRSHTPDFLSDRIALLEQHGFVQARSFYRMQRDLSQPIPEAALAPGIHLLNWTPELDAATLHAVNEAFADHWGFIPVDEESWKLWITSNSVFRPELTYLALTEDGELVGFSVNEVREEENAALGIRQGWIHELGVCRAWRKQGIATALICISMQAFKRAGLDYAGLGVDSENLTGALRIYERLGFYVVKRFLTYTKLVHTPEGANTTG